MSQKQCIWVMALTVISGFLGGAVASRLFVGQSAYGSEMSFQLDEPIVNSNNISVRNIKLVDAEGKIRAHLGLNDNGEPNLTFFTPNREIAAVLGLNSESNPSFFIQGKNGGRFNFAVGSQGNPILLMQDRRGKARAILQLDSAGDPIFALQDGNDKARAILGKVSSENTSTEIPERPISSLLLLDKDEKVILKTP